jgi:hypothetical protein
VIDGRSGPPPGGYAVSNHWRKNRVSRIWQALVRTGSHRWKAVSSRGSVMFAPPYVRWMCSSALMKR